MLLRFGLESGFPLVPLMAYTPYVAIATLLPLAITLLLRTWVPAFAIAIAGLLLLGAVSPRASGGPDSAEAGSVELRVVSSNIYRGRADMAGLMKIIRDTEADLLSLQELTPEAVGELDLLGLRELMPHRTRVWAGEYFGGGIFSRHPLEGLEPIETPPRVKATGELLSMPRAIVSAPEGLRLDVVAAHPYPPTRGRVGDWQYALDALPAAGTGPLGLLVGDFNATLDHDAFRQLLGRGYRDAGEVMGEGLKPTWQGKSSLLPPVTIDHVLADERIGIGDYEVHDLRGTDHETLSATLFLPPADG
jgi:endonuclease/exonuclease/phosphatase family metal-dependent hydrolase